MEIRQYMPYSVVMDLQIGAEGGRLIGDMLKNNGSLEELSLNGCALGDLGLVSITFGKYCVLQK